jgi:alpha-1,6-mannosyltransferase
MAKDSLRLAWAGVVLELIWVGMCSLGPLRENTAAFLSCIFPAFLLFLWTFFRIPIQSRQAVWLVLGFALIFRMTLLFAPPHQSEDVYRYLWDARVSSLGIGPYQYAPNARELESVREDRVYPMINSKPYITAYPPLSQILFRFSYAVFGSNVTAMKAVFSLLEFLAVIVAWRLLILWNQNVQTLLLMAWNPFFIFEFSHSGHSDSAMIFFTLLSLYLLSKGWKGWAAVGYAGAVLAKLHPALWFPVVLKRIGWKPMMAGIVAGLGLGLLYFNPSSWFHYLKSLSLYFRLFEFNASIHYLIRFLGRSAFSESWDKLIGPYLGAVLVVIALFLFWKFPIREARDVLHAGFWLMTADLCLATTVHPWYLCWAALALPFFPYAFMLYWTGGCFLSYIAYSYHPVHEPAWALLLEYIPVYGLMGWELWRRRPLTIDWMKRRNV